MDRRALDCPVSLGVGGYRGGGNLIHATILGIAERPLIKCVRAVLVCQGRLGARGNPSEAGAARHPYPARPRLQLTIPRS